MANFTTNYNLKKPLKSEQFTVTDANDNMDLIDSLVAPLASPTFTGIVTTAGQIKFPAVANPSADANTIDDYKEGTFTPVIVGTGTAGTGTYTTQLGKYQKIGNAVKIWITLVWTNHTGTTNMKITGLPYTSANDGFYNPSTAYITTITLTASNVFQAVVVPNSSEIILGQYALGTSAVSSVALDTAGSLYLQLEYTV